MSRIVGRGNSRGRPYIIACAAVVVLVGLVLGAFSVFGSRTRIAGVDHLLELNYQCESEFLEATYYQSDCEYSLTRSESRAERQGVSELEDDGSSSSDYLLGYYPWIWENKAKAVDAERPHLAHGGTRINIISWDEPIIQIEFASVALDTDVGTWPVGGQQAWQYAGSFANNGTPCAQLVGGGDIVLPALDSFILDNPDSPDSKAVVVTVPWSEPPNSNLEQDTVSYCVELRYAPADSADEQSLWLEFELPMDNFSQQVSDRRDAAAIYQAFGPQKAPAAMAAYFAGRGVEEPSSDCAEGVECEETDDEDEDEEVTEECVESEEEEPDDCPSPTEPESEQPSRDSYGSYVDIESLTIDLPRGWADLTTEEQQHLNPYGCDSLDDINPENGKCIEGEFSLYGWDGTPVRLTVALPADWQELSEEEKESLNPYGCYYYAQIRLSDGKCLGDDWALWGSMDGEDIPRPNDATEERENSYNAAKDIKLYVQTFKSSAEKEAYFTAGPEKHPCSLILDGTLSYIIEADLYIIYADAATLDDSFRPHQMQTLFQQFSPLDPQAVLRDSTDCQSRNDNLVYQQLLCQQSNSTEGNCAATGINDDLLAAIEEIGASCQLMYDNASASGSGIPDNSDLADCLQLKDSIRQDFIEKTQIVDRDHELYEEIRHGIGAYKSSTKLPYTIWEEWTEQSRFMPEQQRYRFEMIVLHEYLHKVYFQDLSLKERMRFHQEVLALYEDNQQLFFDYYGTSTLGEETKFQIGRHGAADVLGITNVIDAIDSMAPQIRQALPADVQEEYSEFLNDRHGITAFIYALSETQEDTPRHSSDGPIQAFKDENLLELDFNDQLIAIIEETRNQSIASNEHSSSLVFNPQMSQIFPSTRNTLGDWDIHSASDDHDDEDSSGEPEEPEETISTDATRMLKDMYWDLRGFFIEGYPIVALETTHPLSDWLQEHFDSRFDRTNLTHYFQYHPRLEWTNRISNDTNSPGRQRSNNNNQRRNEIGAIRGRLVAVLVNNGNRYPVNTSGDRSFDRYVLQQLARTIYRSDTAKGNADFPTTTSENEIYYSSDRLGQTTEAEFDQHISAYTYPGPEELYIIVGVTCQTADGMLAGGNQTAGVAHSAETAFAASDLEVSTLRAVAFIYQLEGETETRARCEDNA